VALHAGSVAGQWREGSRRATRVVRWASQASCVNAHDIVEGEELLVPLEVTQAKGGNDGGGGPGACVGCGAARGRGAGVNGAGGMSSCGARTCSASRVARSCWAACVACAW